MNKISYMTLGSIYKDRQDELNQLLRNVLNKAVADVGIDCAVKALSNQNITEQMKIAA